MDELMEKIQSLSELEIQDLMRAFEKWYAKAFPEWEVVYVALHKDPVKRKQEFTELLNEIAKDLPWHWENYGITEQQQ